MPALVIASWNVHSGVDGWGRPFDVVAGCRKLDADVLVLQETWRPDKGKCLATEIGDALGYRVKEQRIARATMFSPPPNVGSRWGPPLFDGSPHGTRVDRVAGSRSRFTPRRFGPASPADHGSEDGGFPRTTGPVGRRRDQRYVVKERGEIGVAILWRRDSAVVKADTWELGQSARDPTHRAAIAIEVDTGHSGADTTSGAEARTILVVGLHLSHLRHGSLGQLVRLRRMVARRVEHVGMPAVLAGDMNLPGPAVSAAFPHMKRVARGRTWPAWSPFAQPDHILIGNGVEGTGEVVAITGSDHLPVRAKVSIR